MTVCPDVISGIPMESQNGLGWRELNQATHVLVHAAGLSITGNKLSTPNIFNPQI